MPAYEIYYLDDGGAVSCAFSVQFDNALSAKVLAHAMKPSECREMEVWQDGALVYRRPESDAELDDAAALAHSRLYEPGNIANPA